jgi:two-component system sensor histidine kinase/response regulator
MQKLMTKKELALCIGRAILSHESRAVVVVDQRGKVRFVNPVFLDRGKWERKRVIGRSIDEFVPDGAWQAVLARVRAGTRWQGELPARKLDGETYREHATVTPVTTDEQGTVVYLKISEDATQAEETLKSAWGEAQKAVRARSDFIANVSHEIRTPIHAIIGNTELLLETPLNEEQKTYSETVRLSADVLLTLINDVLDFSKIDSGKLQLENVECDVCEVVEEAVGLVALQAHKKGLEMVTFFPDGLPHLVRGDPLRLRQILLNLLNNAVKFTAAGEVDVRVDVVEEREEDAVLRFSVRDTGVGVPEERRGRLFNAFAQIDSSTTRRFGGTGLGLAISKSLAEAMGGAIGVESAAGQSAGSVFWFTARLDKRKPVDRYTAMRNTFPGMRVLIVDDNAAARSVLRSYLEAFGCVAEESSTGAEALALMRRFSGTTDAFRVALIDMVIPGMDGWQIASEINADPAINVTRLILLTPFGTGAEEAKMRLLKWFDGSLSKPVKKAELIGTLTRVTQAEVELEAAEDVPAAVEPVEVPVAHVAHIRALVAEDNVVNQELFAAVFRKLGHYMELAVDGKQAVERALAGRYDIIFMDVHMPVINGLEATRALRAAGITVPVIAVTATVSLEDKRRCIDSGMNDFLPKPFRRNDLMAVIDKYLSGGHRGTAIEQQPTTAPSPAAAMDYQGALAEFMGEEDALSRAIDAFLKRVGARLSDMTATDLEYVASEAHAIKGGALSLRAPGLADAASRLETAARAKNADCASLLEALRHAFSALERFIAESTGHQSIPH